MTTKSEESNKALVPIDRECPLADLRTPVPFAFAVQGKLPSRSRQNAGAAR